MVSLISTVFFIVILFYSIIFHEIAHGYAAYRNGDKTAFNLGRLTLNPLAHIDLVGSILVPILSYLTFKIPFGWAKPVPYNPNNIKHKKYGELEVASAGIIVNLFLAFLAVLAFYLLRNWNLLNVEIVYALQLVTSVNIFLAIFNLLPFPPADGFSIFSELFIHLKSFSLKIKNFFLSKKEYPVHYTENSFNPRNKFFNIKRLFSNPILMIAIIFLAIQVFSYLVPYILSFINYLYSF